MIVEQAPRIGITLASINHNICGSGFVDINQLIIEFRTIPTTRPNKNAGKSFFTRDIIPRNKSKRLKRSL